MNNPDKLFQFMYCTYGLQSNDQLTLILLSIALIDTLEEKEQLVRMVQWINLLLTDYTIRQNHGSQKR